MLAPLSNYWGACPPPPRPSSYAYVMFGMLKYPSFFREKAVQYLRDNPVHEDGTPLECFLSSESWESYLSRMSQENTWGDHLMLK